MADRLSPHKEAPLLETERLILRAHRETDFAGCVSMWSDPRVTKYTIGEPSPPPRTWGRLLTYVGHWALLGFGYWAVEEKASGAYVGELGYADFKRGLHPSFEGSPPPPEMGWALHPQFHGKGYATEALLAACAWADSLCSGVSSPWKRTVCVIHGENQASLKVAAKLGFQNYASLHKPKEAQEDLLFQRFCPKCAG